MCHPKEKNEEGKIYNNTIFSLQRRKGGEKKKFREEDPAKL